MNKDLEVFQLRFRITGLLVMLEVFDARHKAAYNDNKMSIEEFTEAMLQTSQCRSNMTEVFDHLHLLSLEQIISISKELDSLF